MFVLKKNDTGTVICQEHIAELKVEIVEITALHEDCYPSKASQNNCILSSPN